MPSYTSREILHTLSLHLQFKQTAVQHAHESSSYNYDYIFNTIPQVGFDEGRKYADLTPTSWDFLIIYT